MNSNQEIDYLEINKEGVNNIINWYETYQEPRENFFQELLIALEEVNLLDLHNLRYKLSEFFKTYGCPALIFRPNELQNTIDREFSIDYFLYLLKYDKKHNFSILKSWKKAIINSNILSKRKYRNNMSFFDKFDMMIFGLYVALYFSFEHSKEKFPITELNTKKAYHNYVSSNFKSNDNYGYYIHRIIYFFLCESKDLEFDIKQIIEVFSDEENNKNFVLNHISSSSLFCKEVSSTEEIQNGFKIFKDESNNRIPFVILKKGTEFFILDLANSESKIIQDKFKKRLILNKLVIGESNIITCDNKVYQFDLI
jgi:hypothetical protein